MPAFSFEKISPPTVRGPIAPIAPIAKRRRGLVFQILDRFVDARVKRTLRQQKKVMARQQKSQEND
jgi:hypothetical protein